MMHDTHPHLWGAITRLCSIGGNGDCFWRAAGYVLDEPRAKLAVGIFKGSDENQLASSVPFFHGWVIHEGWIIAPTTFERAGNQLVRMDQAEYYYVNGTKDIRIMQRSTLLRVAKEIGLDRMLRGRQDRTSEPWGSRLLDELGYKYEITEDGGLIAVEK